MRHGPHLGNLTKEVKCRIGDTYYFALINYCNKNNMSLSHLLRFIIEDFFRDCIDPNDEHSKYF